jgi:hypothetical protein
MAEWVRTTWSADLWVPVLVVGVVAYTLVCWVYENFLKH